MPTYAANYSGPNTVSKLLSPKERASLLEYGSKRRNKAVRNNINSEFPTPRGQVEAVWRSENAQKAARRGGNNTGRNVANYPESSTNSGIANFGPNVLENLTNNGAPSNNGIDNLNSVFPNNNNGNIVKEPDVPNGNNNYGKSLRNLFGNNDNAPNGSSSIENNSSAAAPWVLSGSEESGYYGGRRLKKNRKSRKSQRKNRKSRKSRKNKKSRKHRKN